MFSVNTLPSQFSPPFPCRRHCRLTVVCSPFRRRSRSRRCDNKLSLPTSTSSSFEPKLEAVIDLTLLTAFQSKLGRFLSSGRDAYHKRRLVVSCRPSTLHFLGTSAALTFLAVSVFTVLAQLISRFSSWRRNASSYMPVLVRRDRSLGGKEVVVAWGQRSDTNPLSPPRIRWWPTVINSNASVFDADEQEEYKTEAYRVVRAITNSRLGGNDNMESDIIRPEMEMVSRGLEKHLKPEQREQLMFLFGKVCGEDSHRIAREALGLMHSQNGFSDQLEDNIAP
ncbi:hypothetical protein D0Y65_028506 [Glycine soja]|uniref:Uncharacterized protein n=1 Tax=Glycine soja TaxID=3848 RepID=A0A445IUT8_GLYSO|nr:hypothetical protein D0Y65_028506 [Glycine soja]